nr:dna polymerase delta subunit 3 [Quercus suber]
MRYACRPGAGQGRGRQLREDTIKRSTTPGCNGIDQPLWSIVRRHCEVSFPAYDARVGLGQTRAMPLYASSVSGRDWTIAQRNLFDNFTRVFIRLPNSKMAQDYTEYLAIKVLNEQQFVSVTLHEIRLLYPRLTIPQGQLPFSEPSIEGPQQPRETNAKKPGAVHATYHITGTLQPRTSSQGSNGVQSQTDEDHVMRSSPPIPGSSAPQVEEDVEQERIVVRSVLLVKEEHLEQAKAKFESISGIHIYSLQAKGLGDMQTLTECNRKIAATYGAEDPLEAWKQYGTIQNPNVKRRTRRSAPPPPLVQAAAPAQKATAKVADVKSKPSTLAKQSSISGVKAPSVSKPDPGTGHASSTQDSDQSKAIKPSNKRQASDIFKSFAKGNLKAKVKEEESQSSVDATQPEDEAMTGFSDDDDDDDVDDEAVDSPALQEGRLGLPTGEGKSKKEREADLQAMMDVEDEPMGDASEEVEPEEENNAIDIAAEPPVNEPKESVTVENGRRRGRRRVMKKKTVKDEDGYLVTKEEAAWESFSEDEPVAKKAKTAPALVLDKAGTVKKAGRPGQGNIMSFFGKK